MNPSTIARTASRRWVDLSLRAVLAPWTALGKATTRDGAPSPVKLGVDRIDAAVRDVAGRLLSDEEMVAEARRRRVAADKREEAVELKAKAEEREQQAEQARRQREEQAERVRESAEQRAEQKKREAQQEAAKRKQQVRTSATTRKQAVEKTTAAKRKRIQDKERAARLEELEQKEQALTAEERALQQEESADKLKKAAGAVKASRT